MKFIYKFKNNESGSVTIFVLTCLLTILMICSVYYVGVKNKETTQYKQIESIQQEYSQKDNADMDSEYDKVINKDVIHKGEIATGGSKKYIDSEGNTAKIPEGFAVSTVDGEDLVSKGLVIIGSNGNEYVWIPCTKDSYKREETAWGVENDNSTKAIKDELTLTGVTPSTEESNNGITTAVLNEIVEQVNIEKESIKNNGGYYIGRYEVGKENNNAVIKANQEPYANIKWSEAYKQAKGIDAGKSANSYLCSSYAWDTAVKFIQTHSTATNYATSRDNFNGNWYDKEVKDKTGKVIKKANTATRLNTGLTTSFANIYDMGGNEAEFTTELNPNTSEAVVVRGGSYYHVSAPAGYRWGTYSNNALYNYGFRSTLFLK